MRKVLGMSVVGVMMGACAMAAKADLVHRFDFSTGSTNDTVGTSTGTLLNGAAVTGGALVTDGGNGAVDGKWGGTGPMMTIDSSVTAGISGAFTIEDWFTCTTNWPKYDTAYAFSDGTQNNYILQAPVRGYSPYPSGVGVCGAGGYGHSDPGFGGAWDGVVSGQYLDNAPATPPGAHEAVLTYDGTTLSYYVDGVLADYNGLASTLVDPGINLSMLGNVALNGGSPYDDPALTGSTYDFRIYTGALSANQVASLYSLGFGSGASNSAINAIATPEPASLGLLAVGAVALIGRRRRA
ncbi:MAG: LamG-like jellyroll fold domain-containing protein [Phycisphaerae bacterium]